MKNIIIITGIIAALFFTGCTTGSHIITGKKMPALSVGVVKIYPQYPTQYEIIGIVESKSEVVIDPQEAIERGIEELKKQAARIGANGIIIRHTGEMSSGFYGTYTTNTYGGGSFYGGADSFKTLSAEAIYVYEE